MFNEKRASDSISYTLTQIDKSVVAQITHCLFINWNKCNEQKNYEFCLTKQLQEIGLNYNAARLIKLAAISRKTLIPVSKSGVRFRAGICQPKEVMTLGLIDAAKTIHPEPKEKIPQEKKELVLAKELVRKLRELGYEVIAKKIIEL